MAIQINKPITFNENITLDSSYVRLGIELIDNGISININCSFYQNKQSYKNSNVNILTPPFLKNLFFVNYNYSVDGDPIIFSHNKYIEYLTSDQYNETIIKIIDENGEIINLSNMSIVNNNNNYELIDENKKVWYSNPILIVKINDNFYHRYIIKNKIFEPSEVTIVDLD